MFKGFVNRASLFNSFISQNYSMLSSAYNFTGCIFWLDASYGLNTITDGAAISSWRDKVSGWEWSQNTAANQPRLKLSNADFNNLPTVDFYDSSRYLDTTRGGLPISNSTTVVFVAKYTTVNGYNVVFGGQTSSPAFIYLGGTNSGVTGVGYRDYATTGLYQGSSNSTTTKIATLSNTYIVVNGSVETSTISIPNFPEITFNRLAARETVGTQSLIGHISEILIYNRKFSYDEVVLLQNNINKKYAIY